MTDIEQKKQDARQSWADEDDNDDDAGKEIGHSAPLVRPDHKVIDPNMSKKPEAPPMPKKDYGPPIKRERNQFGDFVVTTINIPDIKHVVKEKAKNSDDESEEVEEEEEESEPEVEETKEEAPVKKEPVKILSKAEKKKLENEEFERVMKGMDGDSDKKENEVVKE